MSDLPRVIVGVDWATQEHQVCALRPDGEVLAEKAFEHSGDGLADLVRWLEELSEGVLEAVQIAIEVPHGAVVETLLERACQVFSINPEQLDRFRDRQRTRKERTFPSWLIASDFRGTRAMSESAIGSDVHVFHAGKPLRPAAAAPRARDPRPRSTARPAARSPGACGSASAVGTPRGRSRRGSNGSSSRGRRRA